MHRRVKGLLHAQACLRPDCIPHGRPRGAKAMGLRYEAAVAAAFPEAQHGLWFRYRDSNGPGYCNPDLVIEYPDRLLVLEIKLTWTPVAEPQIRELYRPVLEMALGKPVFGAVICRNLTPDTPKSLIRTCLPRLGAVPVWPCPVLHILRPGSTHLATEPSAWPILRLAEVAALS